MADIALQQNIQIIHIPYQSSQAHVTFAHIGPSQFTEDKLALEVANRMFGGGEFNAVLMQELRVKHGFNYGAYSSMSFSQALGVFSFNYSTRQDQRLESIQVAHRALIHFVNQPIDEKRLDETKSGMLRSFPNHYSSNAKINAQLGNLGFCAEKNDSLAEHPAHLTKISATDIQNAVRKYWHPDRISVIVLSQQLDKTALKAQPEQNINIKDTEPAIDVKP